MIIPMIIGKMKMITAKIINSMKNTPGYPLWQSNYHEHVIRDDEELQRIRKYIQENPVKWQKDCLS